MRFAPSNKVASRWVVTRVSVVLCCLSFILVGSGIAGEGGYGPAGDGTLRLFYLYSPDHFQQVERLASWQNISNASAHTFDLIGVVWPRTKAIDGEWAIPDSIVERAGASGDYAVLVYPDARIHSQGSGSDMEPVVRSLSGAHMSTDVDESTWGKIKELFH